MISGQFFPLLGNKNVPAVARVVKNDQKDHVTKSFHHSTHIVYTVRVAQW